MDNRHLRKNLSFGGINDREHAAEAAEADRGAAFKPQPLPKRFYREVSVAEATGGAVATGGAAFAVLLDGRPVKTPARRLLVLPSQPSAELAADEFRAQQNVINPALMPITRLANTVLDAIAADMQPVQEDILRYLACDMLFYRAPEPAGLRRRQAEGWDKALDWAWQVMGAEFTAGEGVMFISQKRESMAAAAAYLRRWRAEPAAFAPFAVAALHLMINLTGSALLALMAEAGALEMREAWRLAHIDEDWTAEQWGKDAQAMERRAQRERDFYAAAAMLAALKT